MSLFASLTDKPWEVEGEIIDPIDGDGKFLPPAYLGLKFFLAVATMVFSLLILSSFVLHGAVMSARAGDRDGLRRRLFAGGVLAVVFLIGQLAAWQQLIALGYYASTNPANAFFYLLTGLHGLHLLGGLYVWARTVGRLKRGGEIAQVGASAELCAIYWHFMLAVWFILFGLMLFT